MCLFQSYLTEQVVFSSLPSTGWFKAHVNLKAHRKHAVLPRNKQVWTTQYIIPTFTVFTSIDEGARSYRSSKRFTCVGGKTGIYMERCKQNHFYIIKNNHIYHAMMISHTHNTKRISKEAQTSTSPGCCCVLIGRDLRDHMTRGLLRVH